MSREPSVLAPDALERHLVRFINETILGGGAAVDRDTRLFEDGYMNSLRILDLIAVVEKALGRRIPDRAVRLANFRSVAAIVVAFHPDAGVPTRGAEAPSQPEPVFAHRTSRVGFASPAPLLEARGALTASATGQVALGGVALDVFHAIDLTARRWAQAHGAVDRRYPSLIAHAVLERAGQIASFPQHLTLATPGHPTEHEARPAAGREPIALSPAVCYHVYPEWEGRTLGPEPAVVTARNRCYRYERGEHVPLERLWEFTMREIVVLGTRTQVDAVRQSLVREVSELVTRLSLDAIIESATDPFFTSGDEGRRLMQQAGQLKLELRLTVAPDGRSVAAASFNHHHEFFGSRFGFRLASGEPAHSGCVAFGLERWVLGVLAQHGVEEERWPAPLREWVHDARRARHAWHTGADA